MEKRDYVGTSQWENSLINATKSVKNGGRISEKKDFIQYFQQIHKEEVRFHY